MADVVYTIQPNPKWYLVNNLGKPLAPNGYIFTYRSLDPTQFKTTYQDPAGLLPWTNPIPIDANGTVGPIYWEFDPENPDELYYFTVNRSIDPSDIVWDFDGFSGAGGSGGAVITTALDLENFVVNNTLYRNIGTLSSVGVLTKVAPGAHTDLAQTPANRGPDICFIKNNTNASDTITFPSFNGVSRLVGDVTPTNYFNYTCNNSPDGETFKYLQFPVTSKVQGFAAQVVSVTLWASLGGLGANQISVTLNQFFGDGTGADVEVSTPVAIINLTSSWVKYGPFQVTIPSVASKSLGSCRNDGLFMQISFPLGLACNINITKPTLFLGAISPLIDYHTNDMVEAIFNTPRTGDVRTAINDYSPFGWVPMNDGTIGNPASGATTRADYDTFPLYNMLWTGVSQAWAVVNGGRGASAIADFTANKPISLTKALGRVFAGASVLTYSQTFTVDVAISTTILTVTTSIPLITGYPVVLSTTGTLPSPLQAAVTYYVIYVGVNQIMLATTFANSIAAIPIVLTTNGTGVNTVTTAAFELGKYLGESTHTQTISEMPSHNHPGSLAPPGLGAGTNGFAQANSTGFSTPIQIASQGGGQPFNITQPTTYMYVYMKL